MDVNKRDDNISIYASNMDFFNVCFEGWGKPKVVGLNPGFVRKDICVKKCEIFMQILSMWRSLQKEAAETTKVFFHDH